MHPPSSESELSLVCEELNLVVEFPLPPGTYARIGSSPTMEITLPLDGIAAEACRLERDRGGALTVCMAGRTVRTRVLIPATLFIGPYVFEFASVVCEQSSAAKPTVSLLRRFPLPILAVGLAAVLLGLIFVLATWPHRNQKPLAAESSSPAATALESYGADAGAAKSKGEASDPIRQAATSQIDLAKLAELLRTRVFTIEALDENGARLGVGTGFAISADGLIVSNYHVVASANEFAVVTAHGARFEVTGILGASEEADLAVLKSKAQDLPFLNLGDSDEVALGDAVAVYGSPMGLPGSLSDGIVSAKRPGVDVNLPNRGRLLQLAAPISRGSSGSPVVDHNGMVIGVIAASRNEAENLNFAIPVESLKELLKAFENATPLPAASVRSEPTPKSDGETEVFAHPGAAIIRSCESSGDWVNMLKTARALADQFPTSRFPRFQVAYACFKLGLPEQAEVEYRRLIALDPEYSVAWNNLGMTLNAQGKTAEARRALKQAAALDPGNADAWHNLALSYIVTGEWSEARRALITLQSVSPAELAEFMESLRAQPRIARGAEYLIAEFSSTPRLPVHVDPLGAADARTQATRAIVAFLLHGVGPDIEAEIAHYAPSVSPYFGHGTKRIEFIRADVLDYRRKWTRRNSTFNAIREAQLSADLLTLTATFDFTFAVSNSRTERSGALTQWVRFVRGSPVDAWRIAGVKTVENRPQNPD